MRDGIHQNTSRELKQVYWGTDGVSTVGIDETMIQAYIEEQGKKDAGQTKFEIS